MINRSISVRDEPYRAISVCVSVSAKKSGQPMAEYERTLAYLVSHPCILWTLILLSAYKSPHLLYSYSRYHTFTAIDRCSDSKSIKFGAQNPRLLRTDVPFLESWNFPLRHAASYCVSPPVPLALFNTYNCTSVQQAMKCM